MKRTRTLMLTLISTALLTTGAHAHVKTECAQKITRFQSMSPGDKQKTAKFVQDVCIPHLQELNLKGEADKILKEHAAQKKSKPTSLLKKFPFDSIMKKLTGFNKKKPTAPRAVSQQPPEQKPQAPKPLEPKYEPRLEKQVNQTPNMPSADISMQIQKQLAESSEVAQKHNQKLIQAIEEQNALLRTLITHFERYVPAALPHDMTSPSAPSTGAPPPPTMVAPPPPPPPPPLPTGKKPAAQAKAPKSVTTPQPSNERGDMLDEIRKGVQLRKTDPNAAEKPAEDKATPGEPGDFLDEIRKGVTLRKTDPNAAEKSTEDKAAPGGQGGVLDAIKEGGFKLRKTEPRTEVKHENTMVSELQKILARRKAIEGEDKDEEDNEEDDDDNDDWTP